MNKHSLSVAGASRYDVLLSGLITTVVARLPAAGLAQTAQTLSPLTQAKEPRP